MILESFRLDGRVAIVTGAAQGLGAGMAIGLAEAGADLVLAGIGDMSGTEAAVRALGRRAISITADLSDRTATETIIGACESFGCADLLINNAGIIRRAPLLEYSDEDWDAVLQVNLNSIFTLSRAFARELASRKKPGKIVNIVSMLSFQGGIRVPAYTASKSALLGLTRAMANELAPLGINVNAIAPGYMATENTRPLREDADRSREILARIPAARWGEPADLQGAAVFLCSPAANYIHGAVLPVDGGWLAR